MITSNKLFKVVFVMNKIVNIKFNINKLSYQSAVNICLEFVTF